MLTTYRARYEENLFESVVPFWLKHAPDWEYGGFLTCLERNGTVYDTRKYMWAQGRAVWMFSRLYNEVGRRQEWLDAATIGVEFIRRFGKDPNGRYYFSLTRDGKPVFQQRKPYAAVFVMLGLLEYSKTGAGPECLSEAVDLFWRIRTWIQDPALMNRPVLDGQPRRISQLADVMVQAAMALELARVSKDSRYQDVMQECLDVALMHYRPGQRILLENVSLDGEDISALPDGRLFNPGHSVEVAWLLLHLLEHVADVHDPRKRQIFDILDGSLEFGWDKQYGGLYYFVDVQDKPTLQLESSMKLWWPHAEALYALILAYSLTRERKWLDWLERIDEYTFSHFVDEKHGEWFGYCDRRGNLTHTLKGNNYKGFFHVPRFLLFAIQEIAGYEATGVVGRVKAD